MFTHDMTKIVVYHMTSRLGVLCEAKTQMPFDYRIQNMFTHGMTKIVVYHMTSRLGMI